MAVVPQRYSNLHFRSFVVTRVYPAGPTGFGGIAYAMCGNVVGSRTWIVELVFPEELPSASASQGQLFVSRYADGWRVWFQYH